MLASDTDGDSEEMWWIKIDVTTATIGTNDWSWKIPTTEELRRESVLSKPVQRSREVQLK